MARKITGKVEVVVTKMLSSPTAPYTNQYVAISIATAMPSTNVLITSAGAGHKIKILKLVLVPSAAVTLELCAGTTGAIALSGAMELAANSIFTFNGDMNPLELPEGEDFAISLGTAVQVSGWLQFAEEKVA